MSATTDKRIETLLDEAEKSGACCAPEDRATRAAMRRRPGKIVEPIRGLFFRADAWEHLEPPERMRHLMRALTQAHPPGDSRELPPPWPTDCPSRGHCSTAYQ